MKMPKVNVVVPPAFTPTEFSTAERKAKFATQFMRLVAKDFPQSLFPKWFYQQLSNCFGHIAHYNQGGFYDVWMSTPVKRLQFVENAERGGVGDPQYTYSDVERWLARWLRDNDVMGQYQRRVDADIEAFERAQLARLQGKYT